MLSPLLSGPNSLPVSSDECLGAKRGCSQASHGNKMGVEEGPGDTWLPAVALGWCSPYETYGQR